MIKKMAKKTYEAHAKANGNKTIRGQEIPKWKDLPPFVKKEWCSAIASLHLFL